MIKTFKYEIYPNKEQKMLFEKHFGCSRWIYNWGLEKKIEYYQKNCKSLSYFDLCNELPNLKKNEKTNWLKEVNSQSLQQSLRNLDYAYKNFFEMRNNFPKFKTKNRTKQSFQIPQKVSIDFENWKLRLPKFKTSIKIARSRIFDQSFWKIKTCTISKSFDRYYISILVENKEQNNPIPSIVEPDLALGIDLGIKDFMVTSDGKKYKKPNHYKKYEDKLKISQKRLSKKKKGSKNYLEQKLKVIKIYEKIKNQRHDFLHKLSTNLVVKNQATTICVEDLYIEGMKKDNKSINDVGFGMFISFLKYKSLWYGKNLIQIDRFDPSSKMCSNCEFINQNLKLSDREWACLSCGTIHDRDINAALNIKNFGLKKQLGDKASVPSLNKAQRNDDSLESSVDLGKPLLTRVSEG